MVVEISAIQISEMAKDTAIVTMKGE